MRQDPQHRLTMSEEVEDEVGAAQSLTLLSCLPAMALAKGVPNLFQK